MSEGPSFNPLAVLKPSFKSKEFEFKAGTAFVVNHEGSHLLLTAAHLFGPAGGLGKKYTSEDLCELDVTVTARGCDNDEVVLASANRVNLSSSRGYKAGVDRNDLYAVSVVESSGFTLAKKLPSVGDRVFLVARLKKQKHNEPMLHAATIVAVSNDSIEYKYDDKRLNTKGTSGAPVINQAGEVIGMNLASAGIPLLNWKGRANSSLNLRHCLREACIS